MHVSPQLQKCPSFPPSWPLMVKFCSSDMCSVIENSLEFLNFLVGGTSSFSLQLHSCNRWARLCLLWPSIQNPSSPWLRTHARARLSFCCGSSRKSLRPLTRGGGWIGLRIAFCKLSIEYLFTVTGVKKMKWFLSLSRCHFQPRVTEGHAGLEMASSERQKPLNYLNKPVEVNNEFFLICQISH